jgi:glycosyltransferase involved in cell wall biosynthesis
VKDIFSGSIRYIGLADSTGYANAGHALVRALVGVGVDVTFEPLLPGSAIGLGYAPAPPGNFGPADLWPLRDDARACDTVIVHFVPEYYPFFIARERARGARRIIGHAVWETDRLPKHWPDLINPLDGLIVATEWNREVFVASGVRAPIVVAPHLPSFAGRPADTADRAALRDRLPDLDGRYVFYAISTWLERKGLRPLIEAYAAAFAAQDRVALVVKTTAHDLERTEAAGRWRGAPLNARPQFEAILRDVEARTGAPPPPIHLLTDELSEGEIGALHEIGDCFVSLSRAEGWGLGAFEAAQRGKPVITTGWGGPLAFLSQETAYLVDWKLEPVRPGVPNPSYTPDQNWAEPNVAAAARAMREVAAAPDRAKARGDAAAKHVRDVFSAGKVVPALLADLARIAPQVRPAPTAAGRKGDLRKTRESLGTRALLALLGPSGGRRGMRPFRSLVFKRHGEPRWWSRSFFIKKSGQIRSAFADWRHCLLPPSARTARDAFDEMTARLSATGLLARVRTFVIVADDAARAPALRIAALAKGFRFDSRIMASVDRLADEELYIVVDPREFRLRLPDARTIFFLSSGYDRNRLSSADAFAHLSSSLAVFVELMSLADPLEGAGVLSAQIHCVPLRDEPDLAAGEAASGLRAFWSARNLFARALFGVGLISLQDYEAATSEIPIPSGPIVLCLPEYRARFAHARRSLLPQAMLFPGLRRRTAWMGCAASYRFLAARALRQKLWPLTVYEDDAGFAPDAAERVQKIVAYLRQRKASWDVFSGLIADLRDDAKLVDVEARDGERFLTFDSSVGFVFSIFNRRALEMLSQYRVEGDDVMRHTIDRFLERQDIVAVTTEVPLATHAGHLPSTLWTGHGIGDRRDELISAGISALISQSQERIAAKLDAYMDAAAR